MIIKAEERILILAPRGRDAEVMQQVLSRRNSACHLCLDVQAISAYSWKLKWAQEFSLLKTFGSAQC